MKKLWILSALLICMLVTLFGLVSCGEDIVPPENIKYDGSYLTWDKVECADHYTVSVNGGDAVRSNSNTFAYNANGTAFDVTVSAVLEDDSESTSVSFKPLATITDLTVANDGTLSWSPIAGANAYLVSANGTETSVTDPRATVPAGNNLVKVKPIVSGDNTYYASWSETKTVYIYAAPSTVRYDGNELSWLGNAPTYEVNLNGKVEMVSGTRYAYNSENNDFAVTIKAVGDYATTFDSAVVAEEFHYLETVKELTVADGILTWDATERTEGYQVKVNGVVVKEIQPTNQYAGLEAGKSLDVQVMPVNTSGNYFSSWSAEKTVYILESPTVSWNNDLELDGEINNNLTWDLVSGAAGYCVRVTYGSNSEVISFGREQDFFGYAYTEVGVYTVEVMATADSASGDYYDSKYAPAYTIERLPAPTAPGSDFIVSDKVSIAKGFTVNYVPVNGASGYQLYKDGVLVQGKQTTGPAMQVGDVVGASAISEQHITYTIQSVGNYNPAKRNVKLSSLTANSLSFDITVQSVPQNLSMSDFTLQWQAVAATNGFAVTYGGTSYTAQSNTFDMQTISAGSYDITVCARGNGANVLPSTLSAPIQIERLQAPKNIKIVSDDNGTLTWDKDANALSYQVFLDLSAQALDTDTYSEMYQYIKTDGTTLHMIAVANYYNADRTLYYMSSQASQTRQFIRLATPVFPEGAVANSIELLWNAPSNINTAEYTPTYQLFSDPNGEEQIGSGVINGLKFDISYLQGGGEYTFRVKAIGDDSKYLDSEPSVAITVKKLATPKINIADGKYTWSGITNASSYYLEIDGKKVSDDIHVSGSTYSYTPRYTEVATHLVSLKAIGDGRTTLDSAAYNYEQKTALLQAPVFEYRYSSETFVTGGSIIVTITTPSPNAVNYQYEIAGVSVVSSESTQSKVIQSPGTYTVRVKALGGVFDVNEVYYVDSQYAGGNDNLTLLASPTEFSINSDGVVQWKHVQGRYGYEYQISFNGEDFGETITTSYGATDVIENYKQYRSITIRIRAIGNNGDTVTSVWNEWTWTNSSYIG